MKNPYKIKFKDLIIFENDDFMAINKPPYIATLDDRAQPHNIKAWAKEHNPGSQVCHRLDKETSGLLLIAKNAGAYRHAAMQFEARKIKKVYHAVVQGIHSFMETEISLPILIQGKGNVKISHSRGKESTTVVTSLEGFKGYSLVEAKPMTGRMHQIRVHLSTQGASIVADVDYGGERIFLSSIKKKYNLKQWTEEQPLIDRVALHAFSLELEGMDGKTLKLEAPYPKDFNVLVTQLRKNI